MFEITSRFIVDAVRKELLCVEQKNQHLIQRLEEPENALEPDKALEKATSSGECNEIEADTRKS